MESKLHQMRLRFKAENGYSPVGASKFKVSIKPAPSKTADLKMRLADAARFVSSLQTALLKVQGTQNGPDSSNLQAQWEYWREKEALLTKQIAVADADVHKTKIITTYDQSKKDQFERPTPKPQYGTFRSSFIHWPGMDRRRRRINEGFPTREEIVTDARDCVLGIGNGFGTGKTELALEGK